MSPKQRKVAEATAADEVADERRPIVRKNMDMDQGKLDRAKALLGARTETETVDIALSEIVFWDDLARLVSKLKAAGGIEDVFGPGLSALPDPMPPASRTRKPRR